MKLTYKLQVLQVKSPGTSLAGLSSECLTRLKSRCLQVMFSSGVLSLFQARSVCGQNSVLYRYRIKSVSLIYCQERTALRSYRALSLFPRGPFQLPSEQRIPLFKIFFILQISDFFFYQYIGKNSLLFKGSHG